CARRSLATHHSDDGLPPDTPAVVPIHGARGLVIEPARLDHVQDQEPAHSVIAEPLPHLGEEERGEAAGMPGPAGVPGRGNGGGSGHSNSSFWSSDSFGACVRNSSPTRCSHCSTSKWCSFNSARRNTGENS